MQDKEKQMKAMLTYKEAAKVLGVPVGTLYSWVHLKKVPHVRLSSRFVRFDADRLQEWMAAQTVEVNRR